jgi:glycosyltransferase involved in cell wall biosynthesis
MYLSIIIPTLNEQAYIQNTLDQIKLNATGNIDYEIIIIDAGSTDKTLSFIEHDEIRVITNEEFKGKKYCSLNHGAKIGNGNVLLFLDADCIVPPNFDLLIKDVLNEGNLSAGAFEYKSENR